MKTFCNVMLWDLRMLFRSATGPAVLVVVLAISLLAAWNGSRFAADWRDQTDSAAEQAADKRTQLLADIAGGDTWSAMAFNAEGLISLPPAPLADIATGRADLDPRIATASTFRKKHELFRHHEIDSPLALGAGRFDFVFVIQILLPLLIVALGYNVLAEERERGLDRVLAVQQVPPRRLLGGRLLARALLILLPLLLGLLLSQWWSAEVIGSPQRTQRLGWALLLILGYLGVWWALVAWIGTWRLGEGQTLLALLAAWVLLVLALPALIGLLSRELHPAPSRFEQIAAARAHEIDGIRQGEALLGQYTHDHPDLDADAGADLPGWAKNLFLTSRLVDAQVAPVSQAFDAALADQRASVERWQFASPALMLQRGLLAAAGTDERRRTDFRTQARAHLVAFREETGRRMIAGQSLTPANIETLPAFTYTETTSTQAWSAVRLQLLVLWLLAVGVLGLAFRRVRTTLRPR